MAYSVYFYKKKLNKKTNELLLAKGKAEENEKCQQTLNQKLEFLFNILPIGITVLNGDGHIIKQNDHISRLLEISPENLLKGEYKKLNL